MLSHPSDRRSWASTLSYPVQGSTFALSLCSDVAKVTFCPLCCRGILNLPNKMHQSSSVTAIGIFKSCLFARCLSLGQLAATTACKWQVRIQISQTRCMEDKLIISDAWFTLPFPPAVRMPWIYSISHEASGFHHWCGGTEIRWCCSVMLWECYRFWSFG